MTVNHQALLHWVGCSLDALHISKSQSLALEPLFGDAGARQYFRVKGSPGLIAVQEPVLGSSAKRFVALSEFLSAQGVHTPKVFAKDYQQGFMLVEDFGDNLLLAQLQPDNVAGLYGEALMVLLRLQQSPRPTGVSVYDQAALREEMDRFREWFVTQLLQYPLDSSEHRQLDQLFALLENSALEQPRVLVHKDFHSRNLIELPVGGLGVIDFQDALWGPLTYDLVSLLRDCYISWPPAEVQRWALTYGDMAVEVGAMPSVPKSTFIKWFDWMGLQRHIKVLGVFSRLWLRDGKAQYLDDLPLAIRYILEIGEQYSETRVFIHWFKKKLLPLCQFQPWYRDPFSIQGLRVQGGGES